MAAAASVKSGRDRAAGSICWRAKMAAPPRFQSLVSAVLRNIFFQAAASRPSMWVGGGDALAGSAAEAEALGDGGFADRCDSAAAGGCPCGAALAGAERPISGEDGG